MRGEDRFVLQKKGRLANTEVDMFKRQRGKKEEKDLF